MPNPAPQVLRPPRELIAGGRGLRLLPLAEGGPGRPIQFFIGVETEDPIMVSLGAGEILLGRKSLPGMNDDPRPQARGDLPGVIGRVSVHDDHLVRAGERTNAARDIGAFIVRNDGGRKVWHDGINDNLGSDAGRPGL